MKNISDMSVAPETSQVDMLPLKYSVCENMKDMSVTCETFQEDKSLAKPELANMPDMLVTCETSQSEMPL